MKLSNNTQLPSMKKIFVLFLALFIIISNLPSQVFAEQNKGSTYEIYFSNTNTEMSSSNDKTITNLPLKKYLSDLVVSSGDSNADFNLKKITNVEKENNYDEETFLPNYSVIFSYTDQDGKKATTVKYYLYEREIEPKETLSPMYVESLFDIGSFSLSIYEYNSNPSFWNGFWVVADGAAIVFPGVPAVSGVKRMIKDSPAVLKPALSKGVKSYSSLQNSSAPNNFMGQSWERHHIFEKRFAGKLGTTEGKMLSIFIPKYNYHYQITQRMSKKIPWYSAPLKSKDEVLRAHYEAYGELWAESGYSDEYWEFLYRFSQTRQYD